MTIELCIVAYFLVVKWVNTKIKLRAARRRRRRGEMTSEDDAAADAAAEPANDDTIRPFSPSVSTEGEFQYFSGVRRFPPRYNQHDPPPPYTPNDVTSPTTTSTVATPSGSLSSLTPPPPPPPPPPRISSMLPHLSGVVYNVMFESTV